MLLQLSPSVRMAAYKIEASTRPEWVLADCPACHGTMKLRASLVGKHAMLCPKCKAPIEIELTHKAPPSPAPQPPTETSLQPELPLAPEVTAEAASNGTVKLPKPRRTRKKPSGKSKKSTSLDLPEAASTAPTQDPQPTTIESASLEGVKPLLPEPRMESGPAVHLFTEPKPSAPPAANPNTPVRIELPDARVSLPYTQVNPDSQGEGRVRPPLDSKLDAEFVSKMRTIEAPKVLVHKVRKRVDPASFRVADWDTRDLEEIPEAEITADEWTQPGPEVLPEQLLSLNFLRMDDEDEQSRSEAPGESHEGMESVRKKRRTRRKVTSGIVVFFQRMSITGRWSLFVMLCLVCITSAWLIIKNFRNRAVSSATEPSPMRLEGLALQNADRLGHLTIEDMANAEKVVRQFLSADGWEAKAAFVRRPEEVKPLMQKWYTTHPSKSVVGEATSNFRKALVGNTYLVFLEMRLGKELTSRFFAVEHIPNAQPHDTGTYLVDWETSVGYQPIELYDYRAKQPPEPVTFRVLLKPDAYFNYAFEDRAKWLCYRLVYPGDEDFEIFGYVPRGSDLAADLEKLLFIEANLMIEVQYPQPAISRDQVIIKKIVHPSWYQDRKDVKPIPKASTPQPPLAQ